MESFVVSGDDYWGWRVWDVGCKMQTSGAVKLESQRKRKGRRGEEETQRTLFAPTSERNDGLGNTLAGLGSQVMQSGDRIM